MSQFDNGFDKAQRAYDNMLPPEWDDDEEDDMTIEKKAQMDADERADIWRDREIDRQMGLI